jgi:hypothetical protein
MGRLIARLLVGVMLFAQMAVAAYACTGAPGSSLADVPRSAAYSGAASAAMSEASDGHADHGVMDPAQPNLCAAHCQSGQQNAAGKPAPEVALAVPMSLYPLVPVVLAAATLRASTVRGGPPPMADPPHAILHCCYRI